ncbi:MAG: methyltransferase domain-containing protein [Streptomycetales bacterium]
MGRRIAHYRKLRRLIILERMDVPPDLPERIGALADVLAHQGELSDPRWRRALHQVPRHLFVPAVAWADPDGPASPYPVHRVANPAAWWGAVYSDASLVTQFHDGRADVVSGRGIASSSCSAPGVVVTFLEHLDLHRHQAVLEIGTGTGWTAALLSWRVGEHGVTSVEVDPALSEQAAKNIGSSGYTPRLVVGDGADGHPDGAPYDRVHATCAVASVPYAWVSQTRPGGVIVVPFSPGFGYGHLVRLDVQGDGSAVGRFLGAAGFMFLRSHRPADGAAFDWVHDGDDPAESLTRIDPRTIAYAPGGASVAISALVGGVQGRIYHDTDGGSGEATFWVLDNSGHHGSWASVDYEPGKGEYLVHQIGPRRLWDEVSDAYFRWCSWGRPARERFGLTVNPSGQCTWLDHPDNVI